MKREEAIKQIKSHISYAEFCARHGHNDKDVEKAHDDIEAFRMAIEALQIDLVRCKDCKHRETDECPMYWMEWFSEEGDDDAFEEDYIIHDYTRDDGYCNYGERGES